MFEKLSCVFTKTCGYAKTIVDNALKWVTDSYNNSKIAEGWEKTAGSLANEMDGMAKKYTWNINTKQFDITGLGVYSAQYWASRVPFGGGYNGMPFIDLPVNFDDIDTSETTTVYLRGRTKVGDGGGGIFIYDDSRVLDNDGRNVFNGWVRQFKGHESFSYALNNNREVNIIFDFNYAYPYINEEIYNAISSNIGVLITGQSLAEGGVGGDAIIDDYDGQAEQLAKMVGTKCMYRCTDTVNVNSIEQLESDSRYTIAEPLSYNLIRYYSYNNYVVTNGSACGGKNYENIKKGTNVYNKLLDIVNIAKVKLTDIKYPYVCLVHGEQDGLDNNINYANNLVEYANDINNDIKNITNQNDDDITLFICQTNSACGYGFNGGITQTTFPTPLQQLKAHEENDNIILACPKYFLKYADHAHITNNAERLLGEYYYKAIKNGRDYNPLSPDTFTINNNKIVITFKGIKNGLSIDITTVKEVDNYGFDYMDDAGNTIDSVSIVDDTIEITLTGDVGDNAVIAYAYKNGETGDDNQVLGLGERGNIRDNDTTKSIYDGKNLYNWLVTFRKEIN